MVRYVVALLLLLTSCKTKEQYAPAYAPPVTIPGKTLKAFSYLALGDSYTIGQSVPAESSFPAQLSNSLKADGWSADPLTIIAQTGWTTGDLIRNIKAKNVTAKFDIVTLLIGVNNQYRGETQSVYRLEFKELLNTAISYANGDKSKVFVLSIPDWGVTPYGESYNRAQIAKEIDEFNAINKEETLNMGVVYLDIIPISRSASGDRSLIANDGLHPSANMYALWVSLLKEKVLSQLKK